MGYQNGVLDQRNRGAAPHAKAQFAQFRGRGNPSPICRTMPGKMIRPTPIGRQCHNPNIGCDFLRRGFA